MYLSRLCQLDSQTLKSSSAPKLLVPGSPQFPFIELTFDRILNSFTCFPLLISIHASSCHTKPLSHTNQAVLILLGPATNDPFPRSAAPFTPPSISPSIALDYLYLRTRVFGIDGFKSKDEKGRSGKRLQLRRRRSACAEEPSSHRAGRHLRG